MNSVSPVFTEKEIECEQVIALDQPKYYPIIVARIVYADGSKASATRFRLTDKERRLVADGADLILLQPHHGSLMPIAHQFAMPNEYPAE